MEWVAQTKLKIPNIIHILDDFLIVEKSREACSASLQRFLDFCNTIGVPMAPEKTVGGRAFLLRLINLTIGVKWPHHYIRLTRQTKRIYKSGNAFWSPLMVGPFFYGKTGLHLIA